jgi:hypothetical protein
MEEDDLLKLCYVINNHAKQHGRRFLWAPVSNIISRFTANQCRGRLAIIREQSTHAEDIQSIHIRWIWFYKKGVEEGVLVRWRDLADDDFDLVKYVTYYLQLSQSDEL